MAIKYCPICNEECRDGKVFTDMQPCRFYHGESCLIYDLVADFSHNFNFKDLSALIEKANNWMDSPA